MNWYFSLQFYLILMFTFLAAVAAAQDGSRNSSDIWRDFDYVKKEGKLEDNNVRRFRTAAEPLVLNGHTDVVRSVCFSPDGKKVLMGSADDTARIWDVR
jgi:WD40 repeat protein